MKIVSVIVTYNRKEKLSIALEHMLSSDIYKVVVVNNSSSDGTKEFLENYRDDRVISLHLDSNTGGAGGFYEGVKYTHEKIVDYDWIVLSDDDAYIQSGAIEYFLNSTHDKDAHAYMSAVYYPSNEICDMNIPGFHPFKNINQILNTIKNGFHIDSDLYSDDKLKKVDFASFVGLFFKKEVVERIGYPNKEWFIYGDDLDYTLKMSENGLNIYFDPSIKFIHDCETILYGKKVYSPMWKAYFTYRNGLIIYRRLSGKLFPFIAMAKIFKWYFNAIYYDNKRSYIALVNIAVIDGIRKDRSRTIDDLTHSKKFASIFSSSDNVSSIVSSDLPLLHPKKV